MQSLSRFALLSSVLFAACTDTIDGVRTPVDLPTVSSPGSRPDKTPVPTPDPYPQQCIAFDAGAAQYGAAAIDEFRDVVVTSDGSILIAGFENAEPTASRGIVLQYGVTGFTEVVSLRTFGTDSFESLTIDPDNDQRVWAAARASGDVPGFPAQGDSDYLLGIIDAQGFSPLARGYQTSYESPKQLAVRDGLLSIVGSVEQLMPDNTIRTNPFVATYEMDDPLAMMWYSTRNNPLRERYTTVDISAQSVVMGGSIRDGAEPGMFVMARSHDADYLWTRRISTEGTDEIAAVHTTPDGAVIWVGTTSSQLGESAHGGKDIVVGKLDGATGEMLWVAQLGTEANEHAADLAVDAAGRIYVLGDVSKTSSDRDVMLLVLDSTGAQVSRQLWGSSGDDVPTALAVDACGTAVLVGHTTGDLVGSYHGGTDGFVLTAPQ